MINYAMYSGFASMMKRDGIEEAARYAASVGFTSVEFFEFIKDDWIPTLTDRESAENARRVLSAHGLSVACYSVGVTLYKKGTSPDTVTKEERMLCHYAEMAAAVGSPFLHHTLIMEDLRDELSFEEALRLIVPVAVRVAKYAHSLGVRCIYEDQGYFFNGVRQFGIFLREVQKQCPYVAVCGDVGNILFADESPVPFFRAYADDIVHVHVKDYALTQRTENTPAWTVSRSGKCYKECEIGTGCALLPDCLAILGSVEYKGAFGFEYAPREYVLGIKKGMHLIEDALSSQSS